MNELYFILAVCSIAYLISTNKISYRLRDYIYHKTQDKYGWEYKIWDFIYQLITCPYCLAFWISLLITLNVEKALGIAIVSLILNRWSER